MDYKEEQDGEVETLKAIYTDDELNVISEDPWNFEVTIKSETDNTNLHCVINFTLPATYPEVVPVISLSEASLLSDEEQTILLDHINEEAQMNIEMAMVFALVSSAQDKLEEFTKQRQIERERKKIEEEEERKRAEEAKYSGTIVTPESFMTWRIRFIEEMSILRNSSTKAQTKGLTGRQMFEKDATLAISDARFLTEMDETEEEKKDIEIDESLFQDLEDLDLDDELNADD